MGPFGGSVKSEARWELAAKDEVHTILGRVFRNVRDETAWRVDAYEYHAGFYRGSDADGIRSASRTGYEYAPATLPYNVCRSAVDTLQSKIAKHRPLPQCLTQRGSWKNQKRARKMTQFLEGEFYRQRIYEDHAPTIVRDALVFGDGWLKVWAQGDEICTERAVPWEMYIDEWDGARNRPRNLYHCRTVDRGVLIETFARSDSGAVRTKLKDAIEMATGATFSDNREDDRMGATVDRIEVVEAWHLRSGKKAKDGRHVIIVEGATLLDEPWEYDYFPFAKLNYSEPLSGARGYGLIEQLEGYQYEINLASEKSSEQHRMSGVGVMVPDNAKIHDSEFRNGINLMHHRAGGTPAVFQMDLVNEHTRQRPRELTSDALQDAGISAMSARSEKPAGITAAVALQALDDQETERFMIPGRAYETWNLQVARLLIDCAKKIANDYGDMKVSVPMKGGLLDLNWNDVYVDGVEIRIFQTSLLPQSLPARLEKLKDMWNTGIIDRSTFLRHLDAPDMQAELDLETADKLVVDEMIERMCDADEEDGASAYMPPSAYQDLEWAGKRCQQKLNRGILDSMDEFNLGLLRQFLKHVDVEQKKKAALAAPPMPPPGIAPPPGATAPPPDLPGLGIPGAMAA